MVDENLKTNSSGDITGTVTVGSTRNYSITGYLSTSHGKVETTVAQIIEFKNSQTFDITSSVYTQDIQQSTTVNSQSIYRNGPVTQSVLKIFSYPLLLSYSEVPGSDGNTDVTTKVQQTDAHTTTELLNGFSIYQSDLLNEVNSADTLIFNASGVYTGSTNRDSSQVYDTNNTLGYCYSREITSSAGLLSSIEDGRTCPKH